MGTEGEEHGGGNLVQLQGGSLHPVPGAANLWGRRNSCSRIKTLELNK